MQPEKAAEVRGRLGKAANDPRGARIDLDADPPLIEDALFHCQQAAEKTLKGFLTAYDNPFRRTHDLDELSRACLAIDPTLRGSLEPAIILTVFAWEFRYPGDAIIPSLDEVRTFLTMADTVYEEVLTRLPKPCSP